MTQAVIQTTVTGMQGRPIATTVPANNQAYTWSGSAWVPTGPFLPLAGGVITGTLRYQYAAPQNIFNDTGTSITAGGLWREVNGNGNFAIQSNTATAGDFSTATTPLSLSAAGGVTVGNGLVVNGAGTVTGLLTAGALGLSSGGITAGSSSFGVSGGQTVAISASGPIVSTGACTFAQVNPQGGNNTGVVGYAGQAWNSMNAYAFNQQSDPRSKKDIASVPADSLASVLAIPVHNYRFLTDAESAPLHWGWLSTEVATQMGSNFAGVVTGTDADQTQSINLNDIVAVLWAAVQELAQKANIT